jgi:hypothetical protein
MEDERPTPEMEHLMYLMENQQDPPCDACEWRAQEIGYPSACPKHLLTKK